MTKIKVYLLGRFELLYNGKPITEYLGNSRKSIVLLKYLIINMGKRVPVTDLIDNLWGDEMGANPENALKTMISRLRSALNDAVPNLGESIVTEKGTYRWEPKEPCEVDTARLEHLHKAVMDAAAFTPEVKAQCLEVLALYKGDLAGVVTGDEWVTSQSIYFHNLYLNVMHYLLARLTELGEYEEVVDICRKVLEIDAYDEMVHFSMMSALHYAGRNNAALAQYRYVVDLYYKQLGTEPSEKILDFYKELIKADLSVKADLQAIAKDLNQNFSASGAFLCDYAIFKDIYQLQLRNLDRSNTKIYIVLLTLARFSETEQAPENFELAMENLLEVIRTTLRKGDIVARYSSSQYAILLPMKEAADGYVVMERIKKRFYDTHKDYDIKLLYQVSPIDSGL